jgi:1-acyl-sn-glycerol-3-phosphate acyltransferase
MTPVDAASPPSFMTWVRSWIYLVAFLVWTIAVAIFAMPVLLRPDWSLVLIRYWIRGIMFLARVITGITCRVTGQEHVPKGAIIVAAQHQASFETYRLFLDLEHPIFILKRELVWIPIIGWYMMRAGFIPIDRSAGAAAMRKMLRAAQAALAEGNQVVVFPEGTRVLDGEKRPYRPGIAALYTHGGVPVIPMALNSGYSWGKTRILKRPGEIRFHFLPALPPDLDKDTMLETLRERLEGANKTLADDTSQP